MSPSSLSLAPDSPHWRFCVVESPHPFNPVHSAGLPTSTESGTAAESSEMMQKQQEPAVAEDLRSAAAVVRRGRKGPRNKPTLSCAECVGRKTKCDRGRPVCYAWYSRPRHSDLVNPRAVANGCQACGEEAIAPTRTPQTRSMLPYHGNSAVVRVALVAMGCSHCFPPGLPETGRVLLLTWPHP